MLPHPQLRRGGGGRAGPGGARPLSVGQAEPRRRGGEGDSEGPEPHAEEAQGARRGRV